MNSKEALDKLYDGFQNGMAGRSFYDIIKQDLNKLKKLKEENKNLKEEMGMYIDTNNNFYEENEELKKVIEILKNKKVNIFHLYVFDTYKQYKEHYPFAEYNNKKDMLNKKEYKLLKEHFWK